MSVTSPVQARKPSEVKKKGMGSLVYIKTLMPNKFTDIFSNDSSASPSKCNFAGSVDGTEYGLNEWATVSKTKNNTLTMILLVLYGAHSSRILHLTGSLSLSTMTHHHTQVKAPYIFNSMTLHMWEMSGLQLVKYQNILTLILLLLNTTQISSYKIWTSE